MKYRNGATVIRFSQPGAVFCPEEKVANEVAVMRFLTDQTSIPVPFILHSGANESPLELSTMLNTPGYPKEERGILDPNIDQDRLEMLYGQMAGILL